MAPNPDSAGEILLRVVATVERFKLDVGIDTTLRTEMAPEDVITLLRDPTVKLDTARNPSALLMNFARPHVTRAKAERSVAVVPMLKWIDRLCDNWTLDEESQSLLKFAVPCTRVLHWLDQIGNEMPRHGNSNAFAKARIRRMLQDLDSVGGQEGRGAPPPHRRDRSRSRDARDSRDWDGGRDAGRENTHDSVRRDNAHDSVRRDGAHDSVRRDTAHDSVRRDTAREGARDTAPDSMRNSAHESGKGRPPPRRDAPRPSGKPGGKAIGKVPVESKSEDPQELLAQIKKLQHQLSSFER
mmetsp:Transcript_84566/g.139949  ORF Transcript_84566/g.139949 Transcript_84566/m.139949 type:complete len:298 (-) Transcript_84566:36-929(-)